MNAAAETIFLPPRHFYLAATKPKRVEILLSIGANISRSARIPITTITQKENRIEFEVRAIGGSYAGTLGENGAIAGNWTQAGATTPLAFERAKK